MNFVCKVHQVSEAKPEECPYNTDRQTDRQTVLQPQQIAHSAHNKCYRLLIVRSVSSVTISRVLWVDVTHLYTFRLSIELFVVLHYFAST